MAGTLKHAKTSGKAAPTDTTKVGGPDWDADHNFAGGALGSLLYRDTGATDGANWLADVATGSVLVSGGVGAAPAWSNAPTLGSMSNPGRLVFGVSSTGHGPFILGTSNVTYSGVVDPSSQWGYNPPGWPESVAGECGLSIGIEGDYKDPQSRLTQEFYVQWTSADGLTQIRPIAFNFNKAQGANPALLSSAIYGNPLQVIGVAGQSGSLLIVKKSDDTQQFLVTQTERVSIGPDASPAYNLTVTPTASSVSGQTALFQNQVSGGATGVIVRAGGTQTGVSPFQVQTNLAGVLFTVSDVGALSHAGDIVPTTSNSKGLGGPSNRYASGYINALNTFQLTGIAGDIEVRTTTSGNVILNPVGDIKWGKALVALGGGSAPTLGTIGGSGPATAAQNSWLRVLDSTGAACWIPVWK